jgi:hypothetical protein
VDDTTLPKEGRCLVGVAHQYAGAPGKMTNCQTLVSLTVARQEVPVCVALRVLHGLKLLFLSSEVGGLAMTGCLTSQAAS